MGLGYAGPGRLCEQGLSGRDLAHDLEQRQATRGQEDRGCLALPQAGKGQQQQAVQHPGQAAIERQFGPYQPQHQVDTKGSYEQAGDQPAPAAHLDDPAQCQQRRQVPAQVGAVAVHPVSADQPPPFPAFDRGTVVDPGPGGRAEGGKQSRDQPGQHE